MKFRVELISHVSIGAGELLSQFSDYVYDGGYVYYLDHDTLFDGFWKHEDGERIMDEFVRKVQAEASGNSKERFNLKGFLEEAGLNYKESVFKRIPVSDEITEQINLQIKTSGESYIPGSTLKGAIRTALIASLLSGNDEDKILKLRARNYIGQNYFGQYDNDDLKHLSVSDTDTFPGDRLGIVKFCTYGISSGNIDIPIVREIIRQGSSSTFTINTKARDKLKARFEFLLEGQEVALLPIINEYARKNIAMELEELDKGDKNAVRDLKRFYEGLLESVKNADTAKEAYLRVGSGKTFYDNTVARQLSGHGFKKIISENYAKADPGFFPKTRTVILTTGAMELPGWIKISRV